MIQTDLGSLIRTRITQRNAPSDRTSRHSGLKVLYIKYIRDKKPFYRTYVILETARKKTKYFSVVLLNFCICITTVNQMQVAPSVCDVESLCTSNNLHFRSKHHKISLAWLRNVFTLFKFICSYITKPTTSNDANFASDELHNFPTKFGMKFTISFRSSRFD